MLAFVLAFVLARVLVLVSILILVRVLVRVLVLVVALVLLFVVVLVLALVLLVVLVLVSVLVRILAPIPVLVFVFLLVLAKLASLLGACEDAGTWPWHSHCAVIVLHPKPDGGERDISTIPHLPRVRGRARHTPVREWFAEQAGHWDAAVAKYNARREAMSGALKI